MAENTRDWHEGEHGVVGEGGSALLESALGKYRRDLSQSVQGAQRRYGFTLYHSLTPEEKVLHLKQLGFEARDGIDHYNLGVAAALQDNFEEAVAHFKKAVDESPEWFEAVHNYALALERTGKADRARSQWQRSLDLAQSGEDRSEVETHLGGLS